MEPRTLIAQGLYYATVYKAAQKPWENLEAHAHRYWEDIADKVLQGYEDMYTDHRRYRQGYETYDILAVHYDIQFGKPNGKLTDRKVTYERKVI